MTKADERRAAIVQQQADREKAEREARGQADPAAAAPAKKGRFAFRRGPGRPPRPRDES
jgi:hypothetical protein